MRFFTFFFSHGVLEIWCFLFLANLDSHKLHFKFSVAPCGLMTTMLNNPTIEGSFKAYSFTALGQEKIS